MNRIVRGILGLSIFNLPGSFELPGRFGTLRWASFQWPNQSSKLAVESNDYDLPLVLIFEFLSSPYPNNVSQEVDTL
jgi:hypothetical protein